jgi:glycosyltransferase involved in cell wall biosynthesis
MRAQLRVLILTADYPPNVWSGIGNSVASQAIALSNIGFEAQVLVADSDKHFFEYPTIKGLNVKPLSKTHCPVDPAKFDILHLHSLSLSELAIELQRRYGLPMIYTSHSLIEHEFAGELGMQFWVQAQRQLWEMGDHVVFVSSADRVRAIARVPRLANRSTVIPNGVPASRQAVPKQSGQPLIVFAGRLTRGKGVDLLIEIVRRLAPQGYPFVVAGGHGDALWERQILRLAQEFPDHCRLAGWLDRESLDRLFAQAAIVLIPSRYEPFCLVALEAMRSGAPVLASAVDGLLEVVGPESGGRLIASRDPNVWCAEIRKLLSSPSLSQQLRRNGPQYVDTYFDPNLLAMRLVGEVYRPSIERRTTQLMDKPFQSAWKIDRGNVGQFYHSEYPVDV